jgi:hypothetical protein
MLALSTADRTSRLFVPNTRSGRHASTSGSVPVNRILIQSWKTLRGDISFGFFELSVGKFVLGRRRTTAPNVGNNNGGIMKISIQSNVAVLDREAEKRIAEAGKQLLGRFGKRVAALSLRFDDASQAGNATCEVVVDTADRLRILTRDRDRDALRAALTALERARVQVRRVLRRSRGHAVANVVLSAS